MTKGLERVTSLVEIGTVAVETGPNMGEVDLTIEDGGVGVLKLVEMKDIGVHEVDALVLDSCFTGRALPSGSLLLGRGACHSHKKDHHQKVNQLLHALLEPALIFEFAITVVVVQAGVDRLDLVDNPLVDALLIALGKDHVLHDLEVLGDRGLVTIDTVL
jgi:hypothetical protein